MPVTLTEFAISAVTEETDAIGEVTIRVVSGNRTATGYGADTDIVVASAHAFVNGLNRLATESAVVGSDERQAASV